MSGLDVERLDMLRDLDGSDTTYLDRAIGNFLRTSVEAVDTLHSTVAEGDAHATRQRAHKLVGTALNLGVLEVGHAARRIEQVAATGTVAGIAALLPHLAAAVEAGARDLVAYQSTYARSSPAD